MVNAELESFRRQIDKIDADIVELLADRFRITAEVGQLKARKGLEAVDPARESSQQTTYRHSPSCTGSTPIWSSASFDR